MKYRFVTSLLLLLFVSSFEAKADDTLYSHKAGVVIEKIKAIYFYQIPGRVVLTNKSLLFYPEGNRQYAKDIKIPLDSIKEMDDDVGLFLWSKCLLIQTKNGAVYKLNAMFKRKFLERKIDSILKIEHWNKDNDIKNIKEPEVDRYDVKSRVLLYSTFLFTPFLNVKSSARINDGILVVTPLKYSSYFKTIEIKASEIRSMKKRGKHNLVVKLNSGVKYRFTFVERDGMLAKLNSSSQKS